LSLESKYATVQTKKNANKKQSAAKHHKTMTRLLRQLYDDLVDDNATVSVGKDSGNTVDW